MLRQLAIADLQPELRIKPAEGGKMFAMRATEAIKAILTDVQFWVPALVLAGGVVLLVVLH
jgi:hypothetical protein